MDGDSSIKICVNLEYMVHHLHEEIGIHCSKANWNKPMFCEATPSNLLINLLKTSTDKAVKVLAGCTILNEVFFKSKCLCISGHFHI